MKDNKCKDNYKKRTKNSKRKENKKEGRTSEKRVIFINEEITDDSSKTIVMKLLKFDEINHKDIKIYINSPGGSVSAGLAIYDTIKYIKSNVSTIAIGRVASMATILLIAGTKGKRFSFPNAEIMIHETSASAFFTKVTEMKEQFEHAQSLNDRLCDLIVENTNRTVAQVKKDTVNKDSWYSSQKALEYGFIDKILM